MNSASLAGRRKLESSQSSLYPLVSVVERLPLLSLFPRSQPLHVELGCGDGTFLQDYARMNPDCNFIGVERLLGRIRKCDRKAHRAGLTNVRLLRIEAGYALEFLLPTASVSVLHVYFPDPWPKRRHSDRRLVNSGFMQAACQALVPEGRVYFRTDDADYFQQMTLVAGDHPDFCPCETPAALVQVRTDFERVFEGRGTPIFRAAYRKSHGQDRGS